MIDIDLPLPDSALLESIRKIAKNHGRTWPDALSMVILGLGPLEWYMGGGDGEERVHCFGPAPKSVRLVCARELARITLYGEDGGGPDASPEGEDAQEGPSKRKAGGAPATSKGGKTRGRVRPGKAGTWPSKAGTRKKAREATS